jgi:hypothetical protein
VSENTSKPKAKPVYADDIVKRRGGPLKAGYYLFHKDELWSPNSWPVAGPFSKWGARIETFFRGFSRFSSKWWSP